MVGKVYDNCCYNRSAGIIPVEAKCMNCDVKYLNRYGRKFGICPRCKGNMLRSDAGFDDNIVYANGGSRTTVRKLCTYIPDRDNHGLGYKDEA